MNPWDDAYEIACDISDTRDMLNRIQNNLNKKIDYLMEILEYNMKNGSMSNGRPATAIEALKFYRKVQDETPGVEDDL